MKISLQSILIKLIPALFILMLADFFQPAIAASIYIVVIAWSAFAAMILYFEIVLGSNKKSSGLMSLALMVCLVSSGLAYLQAGNQSALNRGLIASHVTYVNKLQNAFGLDTQIDPKRIKLAKEQNKKKTGRK